MLIMTVTQQAQLSINIVDRKGNPAPVDGVPSWSAADPTLLAVTPAADGRSALVKAVGGSGTTQVNVTADADLGEGTTALAGVLDVQLLPGVAVAMTITTGTPEEQPDVVPPTPEA